MLALKPLPLKGHLKTGADVISACLPDFDRLAGGLPSEQSPSLPVAFEDF
jgi:hypothetical protein